MKNDIERMYQDYPLEEYPKVESVEFPREINVAFAVCGKQCGCYEFIVDGSTQICEYCYKKLKKTKVKKYILSGEET